MLHHLTRREFLRQAAAVGASGVVAGTIVRGAAGKAPSGDQLKIALIGVGGRGQANLMAMAGEHVAALCDVDRNRLEAAAARFPKAHKYADFRRLLEQEKGLDAVVVSTPDHVHAVASISAMRMGLHVYCEKPLTHSVHEARLVAEVAAKQKVVTQMGTGRQATEEFARTVDVIRAGTIGDVKHVHVWTDRPLWPQGQSRPAGEDRVPAELDWDLWLGPAPVRPFKAKYAEGRFQGQDVYHPFVWRGWWDFGTGALGDIAAHAMNVAFRALKLGAPLSVESQCSGMMPEAFPSWSIIHFDFAARGSMPEVRLTWYDGGKKPPAELVDGEKLADNGVLFVGTKGNLKMAGPTLYPRRQFAGYPWPEPVQPRFPEVHQDWIRAIKTGKQPGCDFAYAGPMTEAYLLGNIALKVGQKIEWDPTRFEIVNCREANALLKREYRAGWAL